MKPRHLLALLAGTALVSLPLSAQIFAGSDDFNSGSGAQWAYAFRTAGNGTGNGLLDFANARLDFSKGTGAGSHFRGWDGDGAGSSSRTVASFNTSWVSYLTVTNTLSLSTGGDYASLGFEIAGGSGQYAALMLTAVDSGGAVFRAEGSGVSASQVSASDVTAVVLRLSWDASLQELDADYSVDGASFIWLKTFNPVTEWSTNTASTGGFYFEVFGNSNMSAAIASGSVFADNFSVTAIPEPSTYAALAGLGALGLVLWRRRQAKSAA